MKKFLNLLLLFVTITAFVGCDKEEHGTVVSANYSFIQNNEAVDTIYVSPEPTTLSFAVKDNYDGTKVREWQLFQVAEYDFTQPVEARPWNLISMGFKSIENPVELDWATIQKVYDNGEERFSVDIQANDSPLKRSYRFSAGKTIKGSIIYIAQVVIVQEANIEN